VGEWLGHLIGEEGGEWFGGEDRSKVGITSTLMGMESVVGGEEEMVAEGSVKQGAED
jgi:hypothetical protein